MKSSTKPTQGRLLTGVCLLLLLLSTLALRVVWQARTDHNTQTSNSSVMLPMDDSKAELPLSPPPLPADNAAKLRAAYKQVQTVAHSVSNAAPDTQNQLAQMALDLGDLWQAEAVANSLLQHAPQNRTARLILATSLRRQARFAEATAIYEALIRADIRDSDAYLGLANTSFDANRRPEAFAWLARGVTEGAQTPLSLRTFAHRYQDWKDYPKAEETALRALKLDPDDVDSNLQLASIQLEGNKLDAAYQTLDALLKRAPDNGLAHRLLAVTLMNANFAHQDLNRARALLERAVDLNPKDTNIYRSAAVIYRQQHLYRLAAQSYDALLFLDPTSVEGRYGLGQVYGLLGRADLSRQQLALYKLLDARQQRVTRLSEDLIHHPTLAESHSALARYLETSGDLARALPEYETAVSLDPTNATRQQDLKRFYTRLGWELPKHP